MSHDVFVQVMPLREQLAKVNQCWEAVRSWDELTRHVVGFCWGCFR